MVIIRKRAPYETNHGIATLYLETESTNLSEVFYNTMVGLGYKDFTQDHDLVTLENGSDHQFIIEWVRSVDIKIFGFYPRFHLRLSKINVLQFDNGDYQLVMDIVVHYDEALHHSLLFRAARRKAEAELKRMQTLFCGRIEIHKKIHETQPNYLDELNAFCQKYGVGYPTFKLIHFRNGRDGYECLCQIILRGTVMASLGYGDKGKMAKTRAARRLLGQLNATVRN